MRLYCCISNNFIKQMVVVLEDETSNKHKFSTTFSLPGSASPCPPVLGHLAAAPGMCPCHGGSLTWHSCLGTGSHPLHPHCPSVVPGYVHRVSSIELASETCKVRHGPGPMGAGSWGRDDRCQSPLSARHQHHQPGDTQPTTSLGIIQK